MKKHDLHIEKLRANCRCSDNAIYVKKHILFDQGLRVRVCVARMSLGCPNKIKTKHELVCKRSK